MSRSVLDENATVNFGVGRSTGKPSESAPRRALGDISNKAATAPLKPRAAEACQALPLSAAPAKPKPQLPSELAALPISARTAEFVTEEVLALARVYAAEGVEALAGLSGHELRDKAFGEAEALSQAELDLMLEPAAWNLDQARLLLHRPLLPVLISI